MKKDKKKIGHEDVRGLIVFSFFFPFKSCVVVVGNIFLKVIK